MTAPIMISVAHSSRSIGAVSPHGALTEYLISLRASVAAFRCLAGEFPVELFDVGPEPSISYDDLKVDRVNSCRPLLAVEIHCNSGPAGAQYSETIYSGPKSPAKEPAAFIAAALRDGFSTIYGKRWPSRGARTDDRGLFFLQRTIVPAVIVEGLFISNKEQSEWLGESRSDGAGAEHYGVLVATGIKNWLRSRA